MPCSSSSPRRSRLLLGQSRFDQLDDRRVVGLGARAKAAYHVPLAVDHELLEIPGHLAGTLGLGIQASQVLVERRRLLPVGCCRPGNLGSLEDALNIYSGENP